MKKISVVLAAAGLTASLGAYATLPTDAAPFGINVPNLQSGLEVTLEGLLVRPDSTASNGYGSINTVTTDPNNPFVNVDQSQSEQTVNPSYDFGFRVGLGYIFPDSGNDVQLNWTHFEHSYNSSADLGNGSFWTTSFGVPLINPALLDLTGDVDGSSNIKYQFDSIDLDVGQYVNIGTRLQTRLFGGLRYAYVKQNQTNDYDGVYNGVTVDDELVNVIYDEDDVYNSKFNGIGPRLGFQAGYNVWNCFGVTGSVAGSLLVGKVKSSSTTDIDVAVVDAATGVIVDNPTFDPVNVSNNQWRIVPELDARLGLNYTWPFENKSALTLEVGYQVTQYFNAVDKYNTNVNTLGSVVVNRTTQDVGYDGPYLSLNYKM